MRIRTIGRTGLEVGCVGLGAMPLSLSGHPNEATGIRVIHAALDAGMTLIDTADVYCIDNSDIGSNERLIAKALDRWSGRPDTVVVATKGGLERPGGDWVVNGKPAHLKAACDRSLAALGIDCIDLYQLHAPDSAVPFVESVGALVEFQQAGKIRHVGLSNVSVSEIETARSVVNVVSVQNRCNPFERQPFFDGVVDHCTRNQIAFLPHSPVGGHHSHHRVAHDPTLNRIAARHAVTPYQVCIAWLLSLSHVMIPIPGASRVDSATSSAAAAELELEGDDLAELTTAFGVERF